MAAGTGQALGASERAVDAMKEKAMRGSGRTKLNDLAGPWSDAAGDFI
jgi:hypothetical protein